MTAASFCLFQTPIGPCGVAWRGGRIAGVQLPEADEAATRSRLARRFSAAVEAEPEPAVRAAVDAIVGLLEGEARDFADLDLDMDAVAEFDRCVYRVARDIPVGETLTYGEVAQRCGQPGAAQAVGRALGRNPFPIVVPCHRVLAARGRIGGFSANGGVGTKRRILAIESRHARGAPTLFDRV